MSLPTDAVREHIEDLRRRRGGLYFTNPSPWAFFFSEAGREVTSHPSALAVWLLVISKQPIPPKRRERERLRKQGLWPPKCLPFSFPVEEGPIHGLGPKATLSGLRTLHDVGAIDRLHAGSAKRGDFARYVLSDRWRQWAPPDGGPNFEKIDWPKAKVIATRDHVSGRFVANRIGKRKATKALVLASKATTKTRIMAPEATKPNSSMAPKAMNTAFGGEFPVAPEAISLISPSLPTNSGDRRKKTKVSGEGGKGLVVERARMHEDIPGQSSQDNDKSKVPTRRELLNGAAKILEQLLDHPRVRERRFAEFIVGQLEEVQCTRLEPDKVRRTFEDQEFLPDFIVNDLFSLIGIDGSGNRDFACSPWAEDEPLSMDYDGGEEATL